VISEYVTASYLNKWVLIKGMNRDNRENIYNDKGYRIRCIKSLIRQIKEDYSECKRLWKIFDKGSINHLEIEELARVISWVKEDLDTFKAFRNEGLEGVTWGEIECIERDVREKETKLRLFFYSLSLEIDRVHT
jgi:hypothetical protein